MNTIFLCPNNIFMRFIFFGPILILLPSHLVYACVVCFSGKVKSDDFNTNIGIRIPFESTSVNVTWQQHRQRRMTKRKDTHTTTYKHEDVDRWYLVVKRWNWVIKLNIWQCAHLFSCCAFMRSKVHRYCCRHRQFCWCHWNISKSNKLWIMNEY